MPSIKLSDKLGLQCSLSTGPLGNFTKLLQGHIQLAYADANFAASLSKSLLAVPANKSQLGLTFQAPVTLGSQGSELNVAAGTTASAGVLREAE